MAEQKDDSQNANREMVPAVPDDFARLSRQSSARLLGRSTLALSSVSGLALIGLKLMHVLQIQNGSFVASLVLVGFSTLLGAQQMVAPGTIPWQSLVSVSGLVPLLVGLGFVAVAGSGGRAEPRRANVELRRSDIDTELFQEAHAQLLALRNDHELGPAIDRIMADHDVWEELHNAIQHASSNIASHEGDAEALSRAKGATDLLVKEVAIEVSHDNRELPKTAVGRVFHRLCPWFWPFCGD